TSSPLINYKDGFTSGSFWPEINWGTTSFQVSSSLADQFAMPDGSQYEILVDRFLPAGLVASNNPTISTKSFVGTPISISLGADQVSDRALATQQSRLNSDAIDLWDGVP